MSTLLRNFLIDAYETRKSILNAHRIDPCFPIQIDDQDDNDKLNEFCTIFCTVSRNDTFWIDLTGTFPVTQDMIDLAEIYNGYYKKNQSRLSLKLNVRQVEALMDLADRIRKTSFLGDTVNNPNWLSISARTISSLYRFVRIIKEYRQLYERKKS